MHPSLCDPQVHNTLYIILHLYAINTPFHQFLFDHPLAESPGQVSVHTLPALHCRWRCGILFQKECYLSKSGSESRPAGPHRQWNPISLQPFLEIDR